MKQEKPDKEIDSRGERNSERIHDMDTKIFCFVFWFQLIFPPSNIPHLFTSNRAYTKCNQHRWYWRVQIMHAPALLRDECARVRDSSCFTVGSRFENGASLKSGGNSRGAAVLWPPSTQWYALSLRIIAFFPVCQRAHDFKGGLKHSFIFCQG